jgi:hypothetical protein
MTLQRTRLLARLFASEPRLVRLVAPPGYAKSTLARLFARRFERHAICDCSGVSDTADFAGRALSALAGESLSGDALAVTRLRLHATEADTATWSRAILEAWKSRQEHALFIIEHADAIAENSGVLALLGDLLAARPPERVLLISSREPLPLRVGHYLAPHQILTLSQNELRFDREEAAAMFDGSELAPPILDRIVRLAAGRPSVLLLLARFAQYDADIGKLIDRLGDAACRDVQGELMTEVLSAFTPDMLSTALAAAAIPNASLEDIAAATGIRHATPIVDRLLHLPGFLSAESGAYSAHPLLLGALRVRHGADLTNCLVRAAQEYERSGDYLRAAELYRAYGDETASAAALDRLPPSELQQPSARLIETIAKIDMATLSAHPAIWIATLPYRRQHVGAARLYDEALRLLESMPPDAPAVLSRRVRVRLGMLAQELEKLAEARALVESAGAPGALEESPEEQRFALMTAALVAAKQGRFTEADAFVDRCDAIQGARHLRFEGERAQIAIEKARLLGDWHEVLKMNEELLYAAQRSGVTSRIVEAARAVEFAAWCCNDDARAIAASQLLEDCGDTDMRLFARRIEAVLSGDAIEAPARALQIARWRAALATRDAAQAQDLFDRAIDEFDSIENDFLHVAIRVCAALLLPAQRRRLLEARVIAQRIESPPLQASLELLIDSQEPSDYGIFKPLAARVARSPLTIRRDVLSLDVAHGHVRRGTHLIHVSDRGVELLVALALFPAGTSKEELATAIWPALDGEAALNALKMCVSRTRAQIADKDVVRSTKRGYVLNDDVAVDVREYERLLRSVRGLEALADPVRRHAQEAIDALDARERAYSADWTWFAPRARRLEELRRELSLALSKDAWRHDVPPAPVELTANVP